MTILNKFLPYRDKFGLNQVKKSKTGNTNITQNGALFTLEYLICLIESGETTKAERVREIRRLRKVMKSLEIKKGISVRFPSSSEFDSMDNSTALLIFSALFDRSRYAKDMRNHGLSVKCTGIDKTQDIENNKKYFLLSKIITFLTTYKINPKNYWNNNDPSKFCLAGWFGRSPGFLGLIDLCAIGKTSLFRLFSLYLGQFLGAFSKTDDQDARKLPYLVWYFLIKRDGGIIWKSIMRPISKVLYKLWTFILMKKYNNGMKTVYALYYKDKKHPLVIYSKEY